MSANGKELLEMDLGPGSAREPSHEDYPKFMAWLDKYQSRDRFLGAGLNRIALINEKDQNLVNKCAYTNQKDPFVQSFSGLESNKFECETYNSQLPLIDSGVFNKIISCEDEYHCITVPRLRPLSDIVFPPIQEYKGEPPIFVKGKKIHPTYSRLSKTLSQGILHEVIEHIENSGLSVIDIDESGVGMDDTGNVYIMDWGNGLIFGIHTLYPGQ
jgi:hypothetical protein